MTRTAATIANARAALVAGWPALSAAEVARFGRGLINDTFAVDTAGDRYVLQRVHPVFTPEIHHNIRAVTEHLHARGMTTPRLVAARDDRPWHAMPDGPWRVMTRIDGVTFDAASEPAQVHAAATMLARFHSALHDLDHAFVGLRTGVHDTAAHLRRLREAVDAGSSHRLYEPVAALAEAIEAGAATLPAVDVAPRIVHGDPKLNNVLFAGEHGTDRTQAVCMIDLDTVGPMPLPLELGDAWRSWCNPRGEDEAQAVFDRDIFAASLAGYAAGCTLALTPEEHAALLHGVEWITLELATRFAADAILESYFGWDRARFPAAGEHNLVRARGQWSLHAAVLASRAERAALLATHFA